VFGTSCFWRVDARTDVETPVSGLLPLLKEIFYPRYKMRRDRSTESTGAGSSFAGKLRGSQVHAQMEAYARPGGIEAAKRDEDQLHPFTWWLIDAMENRWHFRPEVAERVVYHRGPPWFATKMDMWATDVRGRRIALEWKTGMNSTFERGTEHRMSGPVGDLVDSDSPKNQALLELLMGMVMAERFDGIAFDSGQVVLVNTKGINESVPLPEELWENRNAIYDYFVEMVPAAQMRLRAREDKKRKRSEAYQRRKLKKLTGV
jgi:hypothetical protein